jgi:hypothetical protein
MLKTFDAFAPSARLAEGGRVALYAAPRADDPLWAFGSSVIGYDAVSGERVASAPPLGLSRDVWDGLTADPRRYGFHATLKAPFRLARPDGLAELRAALRRFCGATAPLAPFRLEVKVLGEFLALVPAPAPFELSGFAASVVTSFDNFRAPLSEAERERRLAEKLDAGRLAYLERYGYPYVFEFFRFHMSLTGKVRDAQLREELRAALAEAFRRETGDAPFSLDALALFVQPEQGASFRIAHREALSGAPA